MKYSHFVAAVVLVCGLGVVQLFAQAAAESVLTHGLSSAAGSSLGKTLGNAMGNAASQLGGRLGQQTAPSVQRVPATKVKTGFVPSAATRPAPSSSGSLIASIQGGATSSTSTTCAAGSKPVDSSQSKPSPAPGPSASVPTKPVPAPVNNCQSAKDVDSHPAVVNLPAPN